MIAQCTFVIFLSALFLFFIPNFGNPFLLKREILIFGLSTILFFHLKLPTRVGHAIKARPKSLHLALLLLPLASFASSLGASNAFEAFLQTVSLFLATQLTLLLATCQQTRAVLQSTFLNFVPLWISALSLLAVLQFFWGEVFHFGLLAKGKMGVFSTLGNPNYLAFFLLSLVPIQLHLTRRTQHGAGRWLQPLALGLGVMALLATRSLSAYLAIAALTLCTVLSKWPRRAGAGLAIFLISTLIAQSLSHSGRGRYFIWAQSLSIWFDQPFLGTGAANFGVHQLGAQAKVFQWEVFKSGFEHNALFSFDAHNHYLNVLVEGGLLMFILWSILIYGALQISRPSPFKKALLLQLIFFIWNAPLGDAAMLALFFLNLGFCLPLGPRSPWFDTPRLKASAAWGLTLLCLFLGAYRLTTQSISQFLEGRADVSLGNGFGTKAARDYKDVVRLSPENGYAFEKLAIAEFFAGDFRAALANLEIAERLYGDVGIIYLQADIYARLGIYRPSLNLFRTIESAFPSHVTPAFMTGQIFYRLGDHDRARRSFERVIQIVPSPINKKLDHGKVKTQKILAESYLSTLSLKGF